MYMDGIFITRMSVGPWKIFVLLLHPQSLRPSFTLAAFSLPVWTSNVWPLWHIKHIFNWRDLKVFENSCRLLENFFVKISLSKMTPQVKLMCWILWMIPTAPTSHSLAAERRNDSRLSPGIQHCSVIALELVTPSTSQAVGMHFAARDSSASGVLERMWRSLCAFKVFETKDLLLPCWA